MATLSLMQRVSPNTITPPGVQPDGGVTIKDIVS